MAGGSAQGFMGTCQSLAEGLLTGPPKLPPSRSKGASLSYLVSFRPGVLNSGCMNSEFGARKPCKTTCMHKCFPAGKEVGPLAILQGGLRFSILGSAANETRRGGPAPVWGAQGLGDESPTLPCTVAGCWATTLPEHAHFTAPSGAPPSGAGPCRHSHVQAACEAWMQHGT